MTVITIYSVVPLFVLITLGGTWTNNEIMKIEKIFAPSDTYNTNKYIWSYE